MIGDIKRIARRLGCGFIVLLLAWSPARAEGNAGSPDAEKVELVAPLRLGNREVQGKVGPSDTAGLLEEEADNFQQLLLAPPVTPPFPAINIDKWVRVRTCREWMRLHAEGWFPSDTVNRGSDSGFLIACGTVFAIQTARAPKASYLPAKGLGDIRVYSPLLLGAAVPEENERNHAMAAGGRSFGDLERDPQSPLAITSGEFPEIDRYFTGHDRASDRQLVVIRGPETGITYFYAGTEHHLGLIARGDFNGDGIEDFLVAFSYNGGGSLTTTELLVLSRKTVDSAIQPVACILAYQACKLEPSRTVLP